MRTTARALPALLLACAACRSRAPAPTAPPRATSAVVPAAATPPRPTPTPAARADAAAPGPALVDLLHFTESRVAVSSRVANPHDYPEHLVDGRSETAWNGRTGDLVGGWIAFRVPRDARVRRIELSAGFDRRTPSADLFAANHRIARVRVVRDARWIVGEFALDPARREPQPIALDEPGGEFRIEVLEVVPGTRASWRELCVSELRVFGLPGAARLARPRTPDVHVGALDVPVERPAPASAVAAAVGPGPFADPEAYCAAYEPVAAPEITARYGSGEEYPGPIDPPHCGVAETLATGDAVYTALVRYEVNTVDAHEQRVGVRTPRGFFPLGVVLGARGHGDPGCGWSSDFVLERAEVRDGALLVRAVNRDVQYPMGEATEQYTEYQRWLWVCRADAAGVVRCLPRATIARRRIERAVHDEAIEPERIHWDEEHPFAPPAAAQTGR